MAGNPIDETINSVRETLLQESTPQRANETDLKELLTDLIYLKNLGATDVGFDFTHKIEKPEFLALRLRVNRIEELMEGPRYVAQAQEKALTEFIGIQELEALTNKIEEYRRAGIELPDPKTATTLAKLYEIEAQGRVAEERRAALENTKTQAHADQHNPALSPTASKEDSETHDDVMGPLKTAGMFVALVIVTDAISKLMDTASKIAKRIGAVFMAPALKPSAAHELISEEGLALAPSPVAAQVPEDLKLSSYVKFVRAPESVRNVGLLRTEVPFTEVPLNKGSLGNIEPEFPHATFKYFKKKKDDEAYGCFLATVAGETPDE